MSALTGAIDPKKGIGLAKWLIKHAVPFALAGLESFYTDGVAEVVNPDDASWRRQVWKYQRNTPLGTEEDYALWGVDIVNVTSNTIDSTWTEGDFALVEAAASELAQALSGMQASHHTLVERAYYMRAFNPDIPWGQPVPRIVTDPDTGEQEEMNRFVRGGPPVFRQALTLAGGATPSGAPYQAAMSVTLKTPTRKHWGRIYLPGLAGTATPGTNGRFSTAACQQVANLFAEYAADLSANDFYLSVTTTQHEKKYAAAHHAVREIQVDDVPDVIRRRRPRQASVRSIGVASP